MAYVLSLLFLCSFIKLDINRLFLTYYAFMLLVSKTVRLGLDYTGSEFFTFHADMQIAYLFCSIMFLTGWKRIGSCAIFILFSFYNMLIAWYWGSFNLDYYDWISLGVVLTQMWIVTYDENNVLINLGIFMMCYIAESVAGRFL